MIVLLYALIFTTSIISSDAYVLLQVRKHDNNHSKVDALIHKVVPSNKFNDFAHRMAKKPITIVNKSGNDEPTRDISNEEQSDEATDTINKNELDGKFNETMNAPLSLTDADPNVMTLIAKPLVENKPTMRADRHADEGLLRSEPKTIKFRTGESSLLYEVSAGSVVRAMGELLSSRAMREYVDSLSRQAAVVYRSMKEH